MNRQTLITGYGTRGGLSRKASVVRTTKTRIVLNVNDVERSFMRRNGSEVGYGSDMSGWHIPHEELERLNKEF
jgi:hypothetical protein